MGDEYIKKEDAIKAVANAYWHGTDCECYAFAYAFAHKSLDNVPTVYAVPVVWCKECKWWTKQEKSIQGRCALAGIYPTGGWYCGNGERRDDEIDRC